MIKQLNEKIMAIVLSIAKLNEFLDSFLEVSYLLEKRRLQNLLALLVSQRNSIEYTLLGKVV